MKKTVKATYYELSQADIKDAIEVFIQQNHDEHADFEYEVILNINPDNTVTAVATRTNEDED